VYNLINKSIYFINKLVKKIEKITGFSFFFLSPFRLTHVIIEKIFIFKALNKNFTIASNYILKNNGKKAINVISAGIGSNVNFEIFLLKNYNIKKIVAVDPTTESKKIFKKINYKNFFFENKALFINNKKVKIFLPQENKKKNPNLSIENIYSSSKYIYTKPITVTDIIKKYRIRKINILKLDVEGVADKIINDLANKKIYPEQILFELERPYSILKQFTFFRNFITLIFLLKKRYFLYYYTSSKLGFRSEILAVKK
jgi:FkbM family methyltransferase